MKQPANAPVQSRMTKVFMNGRNQAVRIPAQYRFEDEELFVNKIGNTLMLTPVSALPGTLQLGASLIPEDFMADGIPAEIGVSREDL